VLLNGRDSIWTFSRFDVEFTFIRKRSEAYLANLKMSRENFANKLWRRRDMIKLLGASAITGPMILRGTRASAAASKVIKIGHVSSQTGVFASFAEADPFTLNQIRTALVKGITNGGVS